MAQAESEPIFHDAASDMNVDDADDDDDEDETRMRRRRENVQ